MCFTVFLSMGMKKIVCRVNFKNSIADLKAPRFPQQTQGSEDGFPAHILSRENMPPLAEGGGR